MTEKFHLIKGYRKSSSSISLTLILPANDFITNTIYYDTLQLINFAVRSNEDIIDESRSPIKTTTHWV